MSGRSGKNAFIRRCGGNVSTITTNPDGTGILIEPEQSALRCVRHNLVRLQELFRRVTGFHHVQISDLAVAVFTRRRDFRTFFNRLGLPGWNTAGFYSHLRFRGTVCLIDEILPEEWEAQRIITHEVAHSLQYQCRPSFRHDWLLEGVAEYCTLAVLSEPYQEDPQALVRHLIENGCHLSFRDILKLTHRDLEPGFAELADADGLCLVKTFYAQACSMVMHLVDEVPDGPRKFAALLADLRRKQGFRESFEENYGLTLDEWERSWHSWVLDSGTKPRKSSIPGATVATVKKLVCDEAQPLGERASYLLLYASMATESSLPFLREYAVADCPLRSVARYSLFLLGENIREPQKRTRAARREARDMDERGNASSARANREPNEGLMNLHIKATKYAHGVNDLVATVFKDKHPYPFAGGALCRLSADAVAYHESVFAVCCTGWAHCCAPLLRTLLDELLNVLVIVEHRGEADLRGFRCTHFFLKADLNSDDERLRTNARNQIEASLKRLAPDARKKAHEFAYSEKRRGYWYPPEYGTPQRVCEKLAPRWVPLYQMLSSAAHGGYLGQGLFRDRPGDVHANPRDDPESQEMALAGSTRTILEMTQVRDQFELGGKLTCAYDSILDELSNLMHKLGYPDRWRESK